MHRFFVEDNAIEGEVVKITGSDFNHISHSLRMQVGDQFIQNNGGHVYHPWPAYFKNRDSWICSIDCVVISSR